MMARCCQRDMHCFRDVAPLLPESQRAAHFREKPGCPQVYRGLTLGPMRCGGAIGGKSGALGQKIVKIHGGCLLSLAYTKNTNGIT